LQVVVGFQQEDVHVTHSVGDGAWGVTEVGQHAYLAYGGVEEEADRVGGVVGYAKGFDGHIAKVEGLAGLEESEVEVDGQKAGDLLAGMAVAVERKVEFAGDVLEPLDVVRVLVGDEDAVEVFRSATDARKALANLAGTEAAVDQ